MAIKMNDMEHPEAPNVNSQMKEEKNDARCAARWFTTIYILLFPICFGMAWFSPMVFDCPRMTALVGLSIIFLMCLIPLSVPVSIYLMWSRFSKGHYKKLYIFCFLPIFTFIGASILSEVLMALLRYFVPL